MLARALELGALARSCVAGRNPSRVLVRVVGAQQGPCAGGGGTAACQSPHEQEHVELEAIFSDGGVRSPSV